MKYKATIEKADSFNAVLMTENGFPIYDVMVPTRDGYCSASSIVFYTEDENLLKEFKDLSTEKRKEFLYNHPESVKTLNEVFSYSKEMHHPMPLAYNHLLYDFERTIRQGNYGCTHLIKDNELLIFHQSSLFARTGYKINNHKEFNDLYDELEKLVVTEYKEGKIQPDGVIKGKAVERLKSKNPEIFKELSKYQDNVLDVVKTFKYELLDHCRLTYDKSDDLIIHLEVNEIKYDIKVPKNAKENIELICNHEREELKNVTELIDNIYEKVTHNRLTNFKAKMKIK